MQHSPPAKVSSQEKEVEVPKYDFEAMLEQAMKNDGQTYEDMAAEEEQVDTKPKSNRQKKFLK